MAHEHKITDANCEHPSAAILAAEGVVPIPPAKSTAGRAPFLETVMEPQAPGRRGSMLSGNEACSLALASGAASGDLATAS